MKSFSDLGKVLSGIVVAFPVFAIAAVVAYKLFKLFPNGLFLLEFIIVILIINAATE